MQLDQGYEEGEHLSEAISLTNKEKLCLVRMPHDFDPRLLEKVQLRSMLLGMEEDGAAIGNQKKQKQKQQHGSSLQKHGLGDDYQVSIQAKCNEVSTFRAIVNGDKQSNIGPAFDSMVSISKTLVPLNGSGGVNVSALQMSIGSRLPKNMVLSIPSSYGRMDQVEDLRRSYKKKISEPSEKTPSSSGKKRKSDSKSDQKKKQKKGKKS